MPIPVRNIYYLLCYAWDCLEARTSMDVDAMPGNRVENLLGHVMSNGVSDLLRRGLDRGYIGFEDEERRIRGKLLLSPTVQRVLLPRGRVVCRFDELSHDVAHNRVIKAAMRALIALPSLDHDLRVRLRELCQRMHGVPDIELSPAAFRSIQLHRSNARYAFLVNLARLVERSLLPDEETGGRRFHPFTASEQEMGLLFEAFVRNFLRREQDLFQVASAKVPWSVEPLAGTSVAWLPEMRLDVMLTGPSRRIAIETKYYATPHQSYHGSKKLISGHLYQLLTYLSQLDCTPGPEPLGVLLYAGAGEDQRLDYRIGGHTLLVRGLDLDAEWQEIHRSLLGLVRELLDHGETRRSECLQTVG